MEVDLDVEEVHDRPQVESVVTIGGNENQTGEIGENDNLRTEVGKIYFWDKTWSTISRACHTLCRTGSDLLPYP
jgi:hypothetical protein